MTPLYTLLIFSSIMVNAAKDVQAAADTEYAIALQEYEFSMKHDKAYGRYKAALAYVSAGKLYVRILNQRGEEAKSRTIGNHVALVESRLHKMSVDAASQGGWLYVWFNPVSYLSFGIAIPFLFAFGFLVAYIYIRLAHA